MWGRNRRGSKRILLMQSRSHALVAVPITLVGLPHGFAQAVSESDLTECRIEDLMEQKVTSVSKTEQAFSDTAAAIFVISQEDCAARELPASPEALRMVPGLQVERIDSNKWAGLQRALRQ